MNLLDDLEQYLLSIDNEFLDQYIQSEANRLVGTMQKWRDFCSANFFSHGPASDDTIFALRPDWNIDRGGVYDPEMMRQYDELSDELHEKTSDLLEHLNEFRRTAKKRIL
ncbi:MAG: hypothetical protein R3D99_02935 [Altererythrobacter sp.]